MLAFLIPLPIAASGEDIGLTGQRSHSVGTPSSHPATVAYHLEVTEPGY